MIEKDYADLVCPVVISMIECSNLSVFEFIRPSLTISYSVTLLRIYWWNLLILCF